VTLFSLSERAAERASGVEHRGFYTDLLRYRDQHRKSGTITTPAMSVLFALDRQLDIVLDEGIEARWERHAALRAMTAKWSDAHGFEYASAAGARSPTISCLRPPAGIAAPELVRGLAERGRVVGGGYGRWKPETFRIGHMGEVRGSDLERLLLAIAELVRSS
jgi:aspartate aminotransferase-like enzyme